MIVPAEKKRRLLKMTLITAASISISPTWEEASTTLNLKNGLSQMMLISFLGGQSND
jgi:hypothetical protein